MGYLTIISKANCHKLFKIHICPKYALLSVTFDVDPFSEESIAPEISSSNFFDFEEK